MSLVNRKTLPSLIRFASNYKSRLVSGSGCWGVSACERQGASPMAHFRLRSGRANLVVSSLLSNLAVDIVPKARFVAQPGMKCRGQWRPFIIKCQRHGTFFTVAQVRSRTICRAFGTIAFCRNRYPAFHTGLGNKCPFGTNALHPVHEFFTTSSRPNHSARTKVSAIGLAPCRSPSEQNQHRA